MCLKVTQPDYTASSLIRHLANSRRSPAIAAIRIQVAAFTAKFSSDRTFRYKITHFLRQLLNLANNYGSRYHLF